MVIPAMSETTIRVHAPIDVSEPEFFPDSEQGFSNVRLAMKNNEDIARTYVVLLQFEDKQGIATQVVQTDLLSIFPDQGVLNIVDYENEDGKRLLDIFVWTDLRNPQPITSFKFVGSSSGSYAKIPVPAEIELELSYAMAACEDSDPSCDYNARTMLYEAYNQCVDFREFKVEPDFWICNDPRLEKYA